MLENDELKEGGGRLLEVPSNMGSFRSGAYIRMYNLIFEKSLWRGMWDRIDCRSPLALP